MAVWLNNSCKYRIVKIHLWNNNITNFVQATYPILSTPLFSPHFLAGRKNVKQFKSNNYLAQWTYLQTSVSILPNYSFLQIQVALLHREQQERLAFRTEPLSRHGKCRGQTDFMGTGGGKMKTHIWITLALFSRDELCHWIDEVELMLRLTFK